MRLPLLFALALVAGCAPSPPAPVKVMALIPNVKGTFSPFQTELTTVSSITNLQGTVATLRGNARVRIDPNDPLLMEATTDDQLKAALLKDPGGDVHVNLVDKSGVLWPADFHSWLMVTTYLNFERAYTYYNTIFDGKPTDDLLGATVDYWASYTDLNAGPDAVQNNALYFSPVKSFLILPFSSDAGPGCAKGTDTTACSPFAKIPLSMNPGVIGHEYGHWVFSHRVFGNAAVPTPLTQWSLEPFNLLKSIDEGFADFHGHGVTCLTQAGCRFFLPWSIDETKTDVVHQRDYTDASDSKCMTTNLRTALTMLDGGQFLAGGNQYLLGTLFTVAMYQASEPLGKRDLMQKALVASYDDDSASNPGLKQLIESNLNTSANFTPEAVVDVIAGHITDPELLKAFCGEAANRLQLVCDGNNTPVSAFPCVTLPHCGATPTPHTTCPTL